MSEPTYRLPDWLGGHPCRILDFPPSGPDGSVWVQIEEEISPTHHHFAPVGLLRSDLVEVRPPSIDAPVLTDPGLTVLEIRDSRLEGCAATVSIGQDGGVAEEVGLSVTQLRLLARAAWQRANAIEGVPAVPDILAEWRERAATAERERDEARAELELVRTVIGEKAITELLGAPSTVDLPALPSGLEFPGDDVAERLPDGGWVVRGGSAADVYAADIPTPLRGGPNCGRRVNEWSCTRHIGEWCVADTGKGGRVGAIWRRWGAQS